MLPGKLSYLIELHQLMVENIRSTTASGSKITRELKTPAEAGVSPGEWVQLAEDYMLARSMCQWLDPTTELGEHWFGVLAYTGGILFKVDNGGDESV